MRTCASCKESKPLSEWGKSYCKQCHRDNASKYYHNNAALVLEKARKRYADDPDVRKRHHEYNSSFNGRLRTIKHGAKKRELKYDLPNILLWDLLTDRCFYCGQVPKPYGGVDRVVSSQGYKFGNVVSCCHRCNEAKMNLSLSEFQTWANRVVAWGQR
jgi:hypothetical protein